MFNYLKLQSVHIYIYIYIYTYMYTDGNRSLRSVYTYTCSTTAAVYKTFTNFDEQICFVNDFSTSNRVHSFSSLQEIHSVKTLVRT